MNKYIYQIMESAKEAVEKTFRLADTIAELCVNVFEEREVDGMQFDPATLSYILTVGSGVYRIKIDLNDKAVKISAHKSVTNLIVAYCHIGVNGEFKVEYGHGYTPIKTTALRLFDEIEKLDLDTLFMISDNKTDNDVDIVQSDLEE